MIDKGFGLVKLKLEDWNFVRFGEILSKNAQAVYCIVLLAEERSQTRSGKHPHFIPFSPLQKKKGRKKSPHSVSRTNPPPHTPTCRESANISFIVVCVFLLCIGG